MTASDYFICNLRVFNNKRKTDSTKIHSRSPRFISVLFMIHFFLWTAHQPSKTYILDRCVFRVSIYTSKFISRTVGEGLGKRRATETSLTVRTVVSAGTRVIRVNRIKLLRTA